MSAGNRARTITRILLLLLTVAGAGAGYWFWQKNRTAAQSANVMTAPVTRGDIEVTVLATGILKPVRLVAVGAQVSGRVTTLHVELGQQVKAGDLIAEIDSVTQENALRTAQAALANVRAQRTEKQASLKLAEITLERQRRMAAQRASSQADLDTAQADVGVIRAQIEALDAQIIESEVAVENARANLGYTRITAPIDGTVLAVVSQEGQTVNAVQSAPTIVVLGQLDTMTVRAEISEADVVRVAPGQPVYFTILGEPDRRYDATLRRIEPAPESITSDSSLSTSLSSASSSSSTASTAIYYNGVFDIPNPDGRLRTYMTAEVHIVLGRAQGALTIPATALGAAGGDGTHGVQVLEPSGQIATRQVKIGLNNKITAEVLSGLEEGERIVMGTYSATATSATPARRGPPSPMGF
ncbi:macrolide-specific efflux system membrane fusion protein [Pseudochelatococcus lubricantis]|uniref:Macrolide-specific efflux system membrane fusion protein n=1 Tax=Pseudochelatococcus lubricantis TaxID=1538102 RepID=A0ABX0UZB9_9HYPH|nr:efflux RND transporter periplasmic adaptor subunit [Pseudochelatococcus lubricantis]NIJ58307.1 macrolide-specific efflux system membrane fusion protein [Pseudochelatococcus lubricantis]